MTTPNVDINIVMPYGVTVEGNGSKFAPPTKPHSQRVGTTGIALPDGPCLVKATWDSNPVDIDVRVLDSTSSIVRKIGTLKTGGVCHGHGGCEGGLVYSVARQKHFAARHDRNHRGLPGGVHRVARRAGTVV